MLSARRYVLHFSVHHRWVCFLELSGFFRKHMTQICIKAIFDFFFPLIRVKRENIFVEYFLFTISQMMTYTLFRLIFIITL